MIAAALAAAPKGPSGLPADWSGWLVLIVLGLLVLRGLVKLLGGGK